MQIVFSESVRTGIGAEGQSEERQVFIGEQQGVWSAGWRSADDLSASEEDVWYEGMSWEAARGLSVRRSKQR